jgi:hypothetical protein
MIWCLFIASSVAVLGATEPKSVLKLEAQLKAELNNVKAVSQALEQKLHGTTAPTKAPTQAAQLLQSELAVALEKAKHLEQELSQKEHQPTSPTVAPATPLVHLAGGPAPSPAGSKITSSVLDRCYKRRGKAFCDRLKQ